jgi:hypothetical protein
MRDPLSSRGAGTYGTYDFLNSLEGLATLSGTNLEGYDFDDFANKIYSPRGGDDSIRGASPHRWSLGSMDNNMFFSDGSASRPPSNRNSGNSEFFDLNQKISNSNPDSGVKTAGGLLKKRSMAALRNISVGSDFSDSIILEDPNTEV